MKVIATIQVNLGRSGIGTRCRLGDDLDGTTILRRTVERALACHRVEEVYVLCPPSQTDECERMIGPTRARITGVDRGEAPWAELVRSARRWSLTGWRGGLGGSTFFDEYVDCRVLAELADRVEAQLVLCVPPAAPLFDPALADRMIDHKQKMDSDFRMVFSQTPPGLSGLVLDRVLIQELARANSPVGWAFSYQPDAPRRDLIFEPCCLEVPREVRHAVGRLSVDCDRAEAMVEECIRAKCGDDAKTVGRWLIDRRTHFTDSLPHEVEIELTTDDPFPDAVLKPRGDRLEVRGPINIALVEAVVRCITQQDDALLIVGGFGDPLRHPAFTETLRAIRNVDGTEHPLYGLAVRTTGVDLSPDIVRAMIECRVDVLAVTLDAWSADLYSTLQDPCGTAGSSLDDVKAAIDMVASVRSEHGSVHPIVVPEITKAKQNVHELDAFHDGWIRHLGTVTIGAASTYAQQFEDHRVINMAPAARSACKRIGTRCVVLADGRVIPCDQDMNGRLSVGTLHDQGLSEIWTGSAYTRLRGTHRSGCLTDSPLCVDCTEWHRP